MYKNVQKCTKMYKNVQKCTKMPISPKFWKENVEKLDFFKLFDTKWGKVVQIVTFQGEFLAEKIPKKFQNFKISRKYQFPWELKN